MKHSERRKGNTEIKRRIRRKKSKAGKREKKNNGRDRSKKTKRAIKTKIFKT